SRAGCTMSRGRLHRCNVPPGGGRCSRAGVTAVKVCGQDEPSRRVRTMRSAWACGRVMAAGIVLAAVLSWRNARAAEDGPAPLIRYSNDALTVRLSSVPNSDVLEEVARQSGAEIRGQVREPHEVS